MQTHDTTKSYEEETNLMHVGFPQSSWHAFRSATHDTSPHMFWKLLEYQSRPLRVLYVRENKLGNTSFQVSTVHVAQIMVFWVLTPHIFTSFFQCCGGMCCFHHHGDYIWFRQIPSNYSPCSERYGYVSVKAWRKHIKRTALTDQA